MHHDEIKLVVLDYLGGSEADVFACTLEDTKLGKQLVLHASRSMGLSALREQLRNALHASNLDVIIRMHDQKELARNHSLQALSGLFGTGEIVFDPVGAIETARAAIEQTQQLRACESNNISGVYFSTQKRELYVTFATHHSSGVKLDADGVFPVHISERLPHDLFIAVDHASANAASNDGWYGASQARRMAITASLFVFVGLAQAPDAQAEGVAVSEMNGKVAVEGGNYDGTNGSVFHGNFSAPLGHSYGVQIDGSGGRYLDANYSGAGVHLFWRDPSRGLLGLIASTQRLGGIDQDRIGIEAEAYLDSISLRLRAGHQDGDVRDGGFAGVQARWYANENVAINLGYEHSPGHNDRKLGVEWQPGVTSLPGLALFAEAEASSNNYERAVVGLRYYFGGKKTLQQRHRQDDPDTLLPDGATGMVKSLRDSRVVAPVVVPPPYGPFM